jgi:hypothetical protein
MTMIKIFAGLLVALMATCGLASAGDYYFNVPVKINTPSHFQLFQEDGQPFVHCYVYATNGPIKDVTSNPLSNTYSGTVTLHIDTRATDKTQKPVTWQCILQIAPSGYSATASLYDVQTFVRLSASKSLMDGFVEDSGDKTIINGAF